MHGVRRFARFKNNCFAVMRSSSEEGSYLRLVDVCVSLNARPRVLKKKKRRCRVEGVRRVARARLERESQVLLGGVAEHVDAEVDDGAARESQRAVEAVRVVHLRR